METNHSSIPAQFVNRHIGPNEDDVQAMLKEIGCRSLDELIEKTVPQNIRARKPLSLAAPLSEFDALKKMKSMAAKNKILKSYIGMGYHPCIVPSPIQRNVLENPGWYTQYTPYQAEISQGRLEALLNFQTMIMGLTGLDIANASLLDEATAAAEAMNLCYNSRASDSANTFYVADDCHPQVIALIKTRATPLNIDVVVGSFQNIDFDKGVFGILLQYPGTDGAVHDFTDVIAKAKAHKSMVVMAADLLSLAILKSPGEWGADIAVGTTQRFGVPMGLGGPHAAYFATKDAHKRKLPGRVIGVSKDASGRPAIRMALQTREQHIRRDKATSNICTSQVLLAIMASMYGVYHGPKGVFNIATRVNQVACYLAAGLKHLGFDTGHKPLFDTVNVLVDNTQQKKIMDAAVSRGVNLRAMGTKNITIAVNETTTLEDVHELFEIFSPGGQVSDLTKSAAHNSIPDSLKRKTKFMSEKVFSSHHSETQLMRYIKSLENKDLSLTRAMIPLGSCTMKLNAASELYPISWPEFGNIHPFAPNDQWTGYKEMMDDLENSLAECTGFDAVSLQPNSGAQGEYAGLLAIRQYHIERNQAHRNVCLIPKSAHGTNPASAAMVGMKVVVVECDTQGNVDVTDLRNKTKEHANDLSALMVTYPSTHGVFEETISEICEIIHAAGGQVYMDGANMNAQVGLCKPGEFGPDVCHLNLHKTFCIPHGGGGPGVGPIAVKKHLAPFLPNHPVVKMGGNQAIGPVSASPYGSACILPIPTMYIWMMGAAGLKRATEIAILNANYMAKRLDAYFPVLYKGKNSFVAHECIVDVRPIKAKTGIEATDISKRLMDYGFHAPTESFPVAGTLMIEPTESEGKEEIDKFCDAMISIRKEIAEIENGSAHTENNILKHAPHTSEVLIADVWDRPYKREQAAFPLKWVKDNKYWPGVSRVDAAYGDRNLMCSCAPMENYQV